jgi:hypothetical protein
VSGEEEDDGQRLTAFLRARVAAATLLVPVLPVVVFFAVVFLAAVVLRAVVFLAGDFFAVVFLAGDFFAVVFLAGDLFAVVFFAVVFFAADVLAGVFRAVVFFAGLFLAAAVLVGTLHLLVGSPRRDAGCVHSMAEVGRLPRTILARLCAMVQHHAQLRLASRAVSSAHRIADVLPWIVRTMGFPQAGNGVQHCHRRRATA